MNTKQIQYVLALSDTLSFSQVAEQLSISQPALSKQIQHIEKELGVALFDRSTVPIRLTPAGEHFVREARELLYKEEQLRRSMEEYQAGDKGQLTIGITPFRSSYLIPPVVKKLRQAYPGITVKLHEAGSEVLRKEAAEGKYDLAVVNLPVDETALDVTPIEPDRLVLVLSEELCRAYPALQETEEIVFERCKDLPFVVVGPTQEMRRLFDKLCAANDFHPHIAAEVVELTTAWTMACAGVGATLLPVQFVSGERQAEGSVVLRIKGIPYSRQPAIVTKRGQYLSDCARYAIKLLTE